VPPPRQPTAAVTSDSVPGLTRTSVTKLPKAWVAGAVLPALVGSATWLNVMPLLVERYSPLLVPTF